MLAPISSTWKLRLPQLANCSLCLCCLTAGVVAESNENKNGPTRSNSLSSLSLSSAKSVWFRLALRAAKLSILIAAWFIKVLLVKISLKIPITSFSISDVDRPLPVPEGLKLIA